MAYAERVAQFRKNNWRSYARPEHWPSLLWAAHDLAFCGRDIAAFPHQQPDGDDTPGVAVAPVAFAGAIIPGVARFIVVLSAHADVFGVGTTVIVGSMLVPPISVISG
jgi:hypothetical protein